MKRKVNRVKFAQAVHSLDLHDLSERARAIRQPGRTRREVVHDVIEMVDAALPWDQLGPVGALLDAVDGPLVRALADLVLALAGDE